MDEVDASLSAGVQKVMDGTREVLLRGVVAPLLVEEVEASLSVPDVRDGALDAGFEVLVCGELRPKEALLLCMPARLLPALRLVLVSVQPAQVAMHACRGVCYVAGKTLCTTLASC